MVQVQAGDNYKRETKVVPETTTPRQVLEELEINYAGGQVILDGATVGIGDLDKSFAELGIASDSRVTLYSVVKTCNA